MHLTLGRRAAPADVDDLLLECHARIRHFSRLACRLGDVEEPAEAEVREAAGRVHRYFEAALPLHIRDEEESLLPRLLGREAELDAALRVMADEHASHAPLLTELVSLCEELVADPRRHRERRARIGTIGAAIDSELEAHLQREERTVIPAIPRLLDPAERQAVIEEMRARRT